MIAYLIAMSVGLFLGGMALLSLVLFERRRIRPRHRRTAMLAMAMALIVAMIGGEAKAHGPRNIQFGLGFGRPIVSFPNRSFSNQRFNSNFGSVHRGNLIQDDFGRVFRLDSFGRLQRVR